MRAESDAGSSVSLESIQAQLEKVEASGLFADSQRLRQFLRFTVEQTLKGHGDQIKEYVIGVEVFGRQESFDPRTDSIVRVQAGRLRARLEKYYSTEGSSDPVVIEYPKGSYVPLFGTESRCCREPRDLGARSRLRRPSWHWWAWPATG